MRFSAPLKKHWLGSFSIVLPPSGLRGFVPVEAKIEHLRVEVEQYQQTHIEMDRAMAEMKSGYERRISQQEELMSKADKVIRNLRENLEQMEKEKGQLMFELDQLRQTMDHEKKEMSRKTQAFFKERWPAECEQKMQENDSRVNQTMAEFNTQRSRHQQSLLHELTA
eukprot:s2253_g8.t1